MNAKSAKISNKTKDRQLWIELYKFISEVIESTVRIIISELNAK